MTEQQHPTTQPTELLIQQENSMWRFNSDYLDAMADRAYELEEAMREAEQDGWTGVFNDEISNEERYACDHYNERYVND